MSHTDLPPGIFLFSKGINQDNVANFIIDLRNWSIQNRGAPVIINYESGGGLVESAKVLYGYLQKLREDHHLTIVVYGRACSCACWILQAADVRIIHEEALLMYHYLTCKGEANLREMRQMMRHFEEEQAQTDRILLHRTKQLTQEQLTAEIEKGDWYITPDRALELKLVDKIQRSGAYRSPETQSAAA